MFLSRTKFIVIAVVTITIIAAGIVISNMSLENTYADAPEPTKRSINVSGYAKITAVPDIAYISLGVLTEDDSAEKAQNANSQLMEKVISAIRALGIKAEDIQTTNFNMYPKYNYSEDTGESKIVGYTVSNSIEVTVRDIDKTGSVISEATKAGANTSNSIRFEISNYYDFYNQALELAVGNAKSRAQAIADALNVKIELPVSVTESGSYNPVYRYADMAKSDIMEEAASVPISEGTLNITANISAVWDY